jgi:hypothetical protein
MLLAGGDFSSTLFLSARSIIGHWGFNFDHFGILAIFFTTFDPKNI